MTTRLVWPRQDDGGERPDEDCIWNQCDPPTTAQPRDHDRNRSDHDRRKRQPPHQGERYVFGRGEGPQQVTHRRYSEPRPGGPQASCWANRRPTTEALIDQACASPRTGWTKASPGMLVALTVVVAVTVAVRAHRGGRRSRPRCRSGRGRRVADAAPGPTTNRWAGNGPPPRKAHPRVTRVSAGHHQRFRRRRRSPPPGTRTRLAPDESTPAIGAAPFAAIVSYDRARARLRGTRSPRRKTNRGSRRNRPLLITRRKAEARMKRGADSSVAVDRVRT